MVKSLVMLAVKTTFRLLLVAITLLSINPVKAQFAVLSQFGNFEDCDTMTRGIYIVWWDNTYNLASDADVLLDTMLVYRDICLDELNMMDPPNPLDGYYYNVYLHTQGDIFPDWWANGQGTDINGYPYLTLPFGAYSDYVNVSHETFHIFQYNSNSPGFSYSGDSQWYIEASANWFAGIRYKTVDFTFREAESLVRLPHVPLWLSYDNFPPYYPQNWQRYVHQYAMALLLFYMTEEAELPYTTITEGFFNGTNESPQEYFFSTLGGEIFRQTFIDWAAHMTNYFDFITPEQAAFNEIEWNTYADPWDDKEFALILDDNGLSTWYRPPDSLVTTAWAFNTYKILNLSNDSYTFTINGDQTGSEGDPSFFKGKVVVINPDNNSLFYDLEMDNPQEGSLTIDVTTLNSEVFFIVGSVPQVFENVDQTFSYEIMIEKGVSTSIPNYSSSTSQRVINRYNLFGQEIKSYSQGIQIIKYEDGTIKKVLVK